MSSKSLALWAAGQLVTNPYIVPSLLLYSTPAGRQFVHGAVAAHGRYLWDMSKVSARTIRDSARRNFAHWKESAPAKWAKANPVAVRAGGVVVIAVTGRVISDQLIAEAGGDVTAGFGVAPSLHLVDGKPWWEQKTTTNPFYQAWRVTSPFHA